MHKLVNRVGLEAEFLLRNKEGELVFPGQHGFTTDSFIILGEIRAKVGSSRGEAIGNFLDAYIEAVKRATGLGLLIDLSKGWDKITPDFYGEILRTMGTKDVHKASNIYGKDILKLTDAETNMAFAMPDITRAGKILSYKISTGLHLHFSSLAEGTKEIVDESYQPIVIPIGLSKAAAELRLYTKDAGDRKETIQVQVSRLTKPDLLWMVKELDEKILPRYTPKERLMFRKPGFYELKDHGFEYRSLPFNDKVLKDLQTIVDFAFTLLEGLELK